MVDAEGRPIAGVEIWRPTEGAEDRLAAVSGPDGLFTVPAEGVYPLSACPPGWLPDESPSQSSGDRFEIRLRPAARIAGRVVDVKGVALSGSIAGLAPGEIPFLQATSEDGVWTRGARARQDATFLIPDLWPGTWTITVELDERESSTRVRILPHDEAVRIDLVLED